VPLLFGRVVAQLDRQFLVLIDRDHSRPFQLGAEPMINSEVSFIFAAACMIGAAAMFFAMISLRL
jgi:hypothetical protein